MGAPACSQKWVSVLRSEVTGQEQNEVVYLWNPVNQLMSLSLHSSQPHPASSSLSDAYNVEEITLSLRDHELASNLNGRTGPNKAGRSLRYECPLRPRGPRRAPGENAWLVSATRGWMVSVQAAHPIRFTAFASNVQKTQRCQTNPSWWGD